MPGQMLGLRAAGLSALVGLGMIGVSIPARADRAEARRIMEAVYDREDGDTVSATMEMTLIAKNGKERVRRLSAHMRDRGSDQDQVMFFMEPVRVKDTGILTYDYDDPERDDDQWLYLPAMRKTRRIAGADKSGSFLGSDFTFADMTRRNNESYDYEITGEVDVRGHPAWQIEATPRTQAEIERTGYKKSVLFVRKDCYVVVRAVHWLTSGNKVKYFDMTRLELIDGIWTPIESTMTLKQGNRTLHSTRMLVLDIVYNHELEEDLFTVRRLARGS